MSASIFQIPMSPYPTDGVDTETSISQTATEQTIHRLLTTSHAPPTLHRSHHTQFLARNIFSLPAPYVALDASRPWMVYWALHSFDIMGVALDDATKERAASTILSFQHPTGGFGGGPGQLPHLLPTYASIMSLAIVGNVLITPPTSTSAGSGPATSTTSEQGEERPSKVPAWSLIDRKALYAFFMRCKLDDGGFVVCQGGEVDVRGIYCLLVVATLLDIITPELVAKTDSFVAGCQTYEGGFASSSFPTSTPGCSPAMAEAHGGYTSCALFSHFLLRPLISTTPTSPAPASSVDVHSCLRWAVNQQGSSIEAGGFRGRTNKLVDGCYGWWVGGLFAVLESLVLREDDGEVEHVQGGVKEESAEGESGAWEDLTKDMLYNRVALQEYVLFAAQSEKGGLRDKPGKSPDLYHTCNNLSGLSSAQHHVRHSAALVRKHKQSWRSSPSILAELEGGQAGEDVEARRREVWSNALGWVEDQSAFLAVGGEGNRVNTTTPVFNVLLLRLKPFINHFYGQNE